MERVHGGKPDMIREGGSLPLLSMLQKATCKSILMLPMGACDDGHHSQNEKLNTSNYINGTKVFAAYLEEVARIPDKNR